MGEQNLATDQVEELLTTLRERFAKFQDRHSGLKWESVESKLATNSKALSALYEMERTGGEPDVVKYDANSDTYHFYDCVKESPKERRSVCYDQASREGRKKFPPENSALEMAEVMGVVLLDEDEYRYLQTLGEFDLKTSSWIVTPDAIRTRGGALFGDRRYDAVFIYHNGADSYYAARGWRGRITV